MIPMMPRKRFLVVVSFVVILSINCHVNNLEPTRIDASSNDAIKLSGNSFKENETQIQLKENEEISVSIPEIELNDEFDILVQVLNKRAVPVNEGDFAILFTVNYIVAPGTSINNDIEKIVNENSESRLLGDKDLFLTQVPILNPNIENKIYIGKIRLKRILEKFYPSNEAIADGNNNLRVWAMVLTAIVLDRSGQAVSKNKKILHLNDVRLKKT